MKLIIVAALCALCGADRLDNRYLPPPPGGAGAAGVGGASIGALQPPRGAAHAAHSEGHNAPAPGYNGANGFSQGFDGPNASSQSFQEPKAIFQGTRGSNAPHQGLQGSNVPFQGFQGFTERQPSNTPSQVFQGAAGIQSFRSPAQVQTGGFLGVSPSSREFNRGFDAPSAMFSPGSANAPEGFNGEADRPAAVERAQAAQERAAYSLRQEFQNDGDAFSYSFETSNGISAEAVGTAAGGVREQGAFSYSGDDGQQYSVTYTADERGYRPSGDHIHPAILRLLEQSENLVSGDNGDGDSHSEAEQYNRGGGQDPASLQQQQYEARPSAVQHSSRPGAMSPEQHYEARPKPAQFLSQQAAASPQQQYEARPSPAKFPSQQLTASPQHQYDARPKPEQFLSQEAAASPQQQYEARPSANKFVSRPGATSPGQQYEARPSPAQFPSQQTGVSPQEQYDARPSTAQFFGRPGAVSPQEQYESASRPMSAPFPSQLAAAPGSAGSATPDTRYGGAPYTYTAPGVAPAASGGRSRPSEGFPAAHPQPTFNSRDGYRY